MRICRASTAMHRQDTLSLLQVETTQSPIFKLQIQHAQQRNEARSCAAEPVRTQSMKALNAPLGSSLLFHCCILKNVNQSDRIRGIGI